MKEIIQTPKKYKGHSSSMGKALIFIGLALVFIFIFLKIATLFVSSESTGFLKGLYDISVSNISEISISLGAIILFFGFLLIFFSRQFEKLADIADEIEKCEDLDE